MIGQKNLKIFAMKKNLLFGAKTLFPKNQVSLFFLFMFSLGASAQVNFTQISNADFSKGVLNSAILFGENFYLQT